MISYPICRCCFSGIKGPHRFQRANHQHFHPPLHHTAVYLGPNVKKSRRQHTSLQVDEFIAGTGPGPDVILIVAAVLIVRVFVTINHDELTMINTCCGLAVADCMRQAWSNLCFRVSLRV